ncbi:class II aldolase/adducin family protein [Marinitoga lauensis]
MLLANHGIVSIGRSLKEALIAAEIIEKVQILHIM